MKLDDLVKTYKFINDPRVPKVNLKFAALFLVAAAVVAGLAVFTPVANDQSSLGQEFRSSSSNQVVERPGAPTATTFSIYIGYNPDTFDPALRYSETEIVDAIDSWEARNVGLIETRRTPVYAHNILIGFELTYVDA